MRAIKQSKISIPLFSKGYASSKWCLKEVAEMVKHKDETKHMILPIFLDVTPDEVQHQTGSYAEAFAQHEENYDFETVQVWRDALQKVVKLKGLELKKEANGKHGEFIKKVLARVLISLRNAYLDVNDILVGINHHVEAIKTTLLEVNETGVQIVGIWGMGGIGKTTLAKVVFNQLLDQFESSCFLNDIRETSSQHKGLEYLQSKLVADILNSERKDFANTDEGTKQLKYRLRHKKAIILLDEVDRVDQLKALAGDLAWFGPGSRIIITTREKNVLDLFQVSDIYELTLLSADQAFELFCKHAFIKGLPTLDFIDLSWDIVSTTGRLPLALEGMTKVEAISLEGYQFRSEDHCIEDDRFLHLTNLRILQLEKSLGAVPDFIGQLTSLVELSLSGTQIRRLPDSIGNLTLLTVPKIDHSHMTCLPSTLATLENLQVLNASGCVDLEGDIPINIGSKSSMRILQLADTKVSSLPTSISCLRQLEILDLGGCQRLQALPNLPSSLISLRLGGELIHIFPNLEHLINLKELIFSGCRQLVEVPMGIRNLSKLEKLELSNTGITTLPGALPHIRELRIQKCLKLKCLPRLPSSLYELEISFCSSLARLPNLSNLNNLSLLRVYNSCKITEIPGLQERIRDWRSWKISSLNISRCKAIEKLPNLLKLQKLTVLQMQGCNNLTGTEGVEELKSLKSSTISGCNKLINVCICQVPKRLEEAAR
ncbi:hypothetical protein CRG98_013674 [Punica granatum]|uniref:TIR domain-containing protein n=1 Tax=Punica granatum TaxID=22663 RepID=A0A2I0KBM5_PUNGR|nr:hypothetical protein CRG98_013674 [Punica granatum]